MRRFSSCLSRGNPERVNHRGGAASSATSPVGVPLFVTERRTERGIAQTQLLATRADLLRSIPVIAPVSAAMLITELPELGRMTSGKVTAMTGIAPVPHDSGAMRDAEPLQADDGLCVRLRSRPHATIQFSSQSQSVSKSAESHTISSSSQSREGWSQSPMPSSKPTLLCNFSSVARHSC